MRRRGTSAVFFWFVYCYLHPVVRIGVAYNVVPYAVIPEAIAAAEIANGGLKVPVLSTIASTPVLSGRDDGFFRTREDFPYETEQMARLIERLEVFWFGDNPQDLCVHSRCLSFSR
ncbi:hypothetical protein Dpep_0625 [Dethiosulfovibrio peptidovorans DSM 11002]|uniref:Uncharacterized protein n=1 Tax=Dethiosulfovibrio peptidovorans DSM 11002 TaxID=469381 RepID=D2Z594_9BACT|nr:hypothetical protein [Dethiosulfovibrio peptidovorans]EFC90653.1 hypothetical protein Dpep_0625 [Dethiosulfovibrio peptidovorans DSM 11002]